MRSLNWGILTDFPVERVFFLSMGFGHIRPGATLGCGSLHIGIHSNSVVVGVY